MRDFAEIWRAAGNPALPDGARPDLELLSLRRFESGFGHLHHAVRGR